MNTYRLDELATMRYGKLPPKEKLDSGCPIFTGYKVSGYCREPLYKEPMLLVVARGVGGTGDVKISPPNAWITNLSIVLDIDESLTDKYFLCQYLGQQGLKDKLNTGSAQAQITVNALSSYLVEIPDLHTQRRIASILSAYDDLIENNTRRIEILEEMARRLYEEWFVHFRFPGHEEGENKWRTVPFASVLSKHIGGGWGKEEADTQHVEPGYVIRGTDIPGARRLSVEKCPYRFHKASNIKTRRLNTGNIVMEVSGGSHDQSVGRALYVSPELLGSFDDAVICASFCKRLVVDQALIHPLLVYYHLDEAYRSKRVDEFQVQSTGIKNFQFKPFLEKEVVSIPPQDLQEKFVDMISPVIRQHQNLSRKNANLRAQRDLLLPKLVSGEIDVSDIPMPDDKEVEAA